MSRLTKPQIARHKVAEEILTALECGDDEDARNIAARFADTDEHVTTDDARLFVLDHWQESARHVNSDAGAFFTPWQLARDAAIYTSGAGSVLDLCAGIGSLGLMSYWAGGSNPPQVTCVEVNPDYARIGRILFPQARWIVASADNPPADLGRFDCVIANPPFGRTAKISGPRFSGEDELAIVDIASQVARWGVFILPQGSCPFEYAGRNYRERPSAKYERFRRATGLRITCESIDTSYYRDQWRGVSPTVEVTTVDFDEQQAAEISAAA